MTGKTILIIDDDRHLLLGLTARLKGSGYKVVCAKDGTAGINLARQEAPDLVILDLGIPGDDGFLVLERMRGVASLSAVPVIVLTARAPADNEKRALDGGAVAFFQKPTSNQQFLTAIRQTLGETIALSTFLRT
jgi:two-component system alkaline phosphatase synthesis response regulator PhoP